MSKDASRYQALSPEKYGQSADIFPLIAPFMKKIGNKSLSISFLIFQM